MEAELIEISNFLAEYPPFDDLPEDTITKVARHIEIAYFSEGKQIIKLGDQIMIFSIVRSGAVELYRRNGELYNRLSQVRLLGKWDY